MYHSEIKLSVLKRLNVFQFNFRQLWLSLNNLILFYFIFTATVGRPTADSQSMSTVLTPNGVSSSD